MHFDFYYLQTHLLEFSKMKCVIMLSTFSLFILLLYFNISLYNIWNGYCWTMLYALSLSYFVPSSFVQRITSHSHHSPHQSNMPGRFLPMFINQFRATWHSTELLTCSLCLTDTEQWAIHNSKTHPHCAWKALVILWTKLHSKECLSGKDTTEMWLCDH